MGCALGRGRYGLASANWLDWNLEVGWVVTAAQARGVGGTQPQGLWLSASGSASRTVSRFSLPVIGRFLMRCETMAFLGGAVSKVYVRYPAVGFFYFTLSLPLSLLHRSPYSLTIRSVLMLKSLL